MLFTNEILFLVQAFFLGGVSLLALRHGKEAESALSAVLIVLANLFVRKQIVFWGFEATAADALAIGVTFNLNLLQEYYGRAAARNAIVISFSCAIVYAVLAQLHLWYIASPNDIAHEHYQHLLSSAPRIIAASIISFLAASLMDYKLFSLLRIAWGDRWLVARNWISIGLTHAADTLLFGFLGLYGLVTNLWQIMLISFIIKLAALACFTPFSWLSKRLIVPSNNKSSV